MTVYEQTGDEEALVAVEKLADYFLKYFGPDKLEFWPSDLRAPENKRKRVDALSDFAGHGVHYSWEGTLLCDPVARLYELTGKKKYLDWSNGSLATLTNGAVGMLFPDWILWQTAHWGLTNFSLTCIHIRSK